MWLNIAGPEGLSTKLLNIYPHDDELAASQRNDYLQFACGDQTIDIAKIMGVVIVPSSHIFTARETVRILCG